MGHISNWFHDHNWDTKSPPGDLTGPKDRLRTLWEVFLIVLLTATVILTLTLLISPDTVNSLLRYLR